MLAVAQAGRLSDRGRRHHIGGRSRNSLISTRSVVLQPRGRHRRVAVNASGDDAKDQEQKTEATPEQAPPKEENAFAQFVADAFASPLLYITLGAAVAVKVVSSSEQVILNRNRKSGDVRRSRTRPSSPGSLLSVSRPHAGGDRRRPLGFSDRGSHRAVQDWSGSEAAGELHLLCTTVSALSVWAC